MHAVSRDFVALGLPPVAQLGFVVRDRAEWIDRFSPLFGPFTTMDATVPGARYRGVEADCSLKLAFGRSGDLEIELIEWVSGGSPHRDFIGQGREGLHHLQFRVDGVDRWIEKLAMLGYRSIWYKRWSPDTVFAYLERDGDPTVIELLTMPAQSSAAA